MYKILFRKKAIKDWDLLLKAGLAKKAVELKEILRVNPFQNPPPYEKLKGFNDTYSRRINVQHRLVYQVLPNDNNELDGTGTPYQGKNKIIRMWTHYE